MKKDFFLKNQIVIKLNNSNCDQTQTIKLTKLDTLNWYDTQTQTVTELKKSNCDNTYKLKF